MADERAEPVFPVGFDEDALIEDLERLPASAEIALREFRKELSRKGGIPMSRLRACQAEGRDGTKLGGCIKTYVPWPDGRFGACPCGGQASAAPDGTTCLRVWHSPPSTRIERRDCLRRCPSTAQRLNRIGVELASGTPRYSSETNVEVPQLNRDPDRVEPPLHRPEIVLPVPCINHGPLSAPMDCVAIEDRGEHLLR